MKGFLDKRNVVVPLRERRDCKPTNESTSDKQFAESERQFDKLLYRIQNLERREKCARNLITSLRREVKRLKEHASPRPVESATAVTQLVPTRNELSRPITATAPPRKIEPLSDPDFSGAAQDLTQGRH